MKQQSRYQILKGLKKKMPEMWFQKSEDWYDDKEQSGSLIVTSEDAKSIIDGIPAFDCLLYTSPSPRDGLLSRMPSSA